MKTIYLHGFAANPEIWRGQKVDLAPLISFENINKTAKILATGITENAIVIGWSMGGMVGLKMTELAPQKIKGLVLVSTTPKFIRSDDYLFGMPPAIFKKFRKRIKMEGISAFHSILFNSEHLHPKHWESFPGRDINMSPERIEKELDELEKIDLRKDISKVNIPVLIIHGDRDEICMPLAANYMNTCIQNSEIEIMPRIGHAPFIEKPEEFNIIIDRFIGKYGKD